MGTAGCSRMVFQDDGVSAPTDGTLAAGVVGDGGARWVPVSAYQWDGREDGWRGC